MVIEEEGIVLLIVNIRAHFRHIIIAIVILLFLSLWRRERLGLCTMRLSQREILGVMLLLLLRGAMIRQIIIIIVIWSV